MLLYSEFYKLTREQRLEEASFGKIMLIDDNIHIGKYMIVYLCEDGSLQCSEDNMTLDDVKERWMELS